MEGGKTGIQVEEPRQESESLTYSNGSADGNTLPKF